MMIDNKQPKHRYRPSAQRQRAAIRQAQERRRNLENGGLERLDAAALRAALAERKAAKTTANEDKE